MNGVKITGVGKALPHQKLSNDELAAFVETSDDWIYSRTGIKSRYISMGETTTDLAIEAAKEALKEAKLTAEDIDLIIVATITPDYVMPSTACKVQAALGAVHATAFDLTAACSGFLYGARMAVDAIRTGSSSHVLVIGAEVLSKSLDWSDRTTCVLFGDGAGAAVFSKHHKNNIINMYTQSRGDSENVLALAGLKLHNCLIEGVDTTSFMTMDGREVYKFATTVVPMSIQRVLEGTIYNLEDISCFILHQANARIMDSVAKKLDVDPNKFFKNIDQYANTSAATIPIALCEAKESFSPGDKIILSAFGGGLTWGSMLIEWE